MDEVRLKIEVTPTSQDVDKLIVPELKKQLNLRVDIEKVPKGTLVRSDYKGKRFIDERGKRSGYNSFADDLSKFSFAGV
ncbi:MAG: hypothetical protein A4E53_03557 [Pelotomaculum sp. PtaB.Bin104]|nr:MAG: hypothetical protein A4E53_03557 [Pelotomaculum sp. PtaB.Bin104]